MQSAGSSRNRKRDQDILVRLMIFEQGRSEWRGIILGAKALDCPEKGGLGFRPGQNFHVFDSLGIMMERMEDSLRDPDPNGVYAIRGLLAIQLGDIGEERDTPTDLGWTDEHVESVCCCDRSEDYVTHKMFLSCRLRFGFRFGLRLWDRKFSHTILLSR